VRCKVGGGHGGHNGLRDIVGQIGSQDFVRLRLGIGHPGERDAVTGHVLGRPDAGDRAAIETALDAVLGVLPRLLDGDWQAVMQALHGRDKP
jgi:PTH1 family peptidyl-tRNA hydrolase